MSRRYGDTNPESQPEALSDEEASSEFMEISTRSLTDDELDDVPQELQLEFLQEAITGESEGAGFQVL
jgi:hypothetical protein